MSIHHSTIRIFRSVFIRLPIDTFDFRQVWISQTNRSPSAALRWIELKTSTNRKRIYLYCFRKTVFYCRSQRKPTRACLILSETVPNEHGSVWSEVGFMGEGKGRGTGLRASQDTSDFAKCRRVQPQRKSYSKYVLYSLKIHDVNMISYVSHEIFPLSMCINYKW